MSDGEGGELVKALAGPPRVPMGRRLKRGVRRVWPAAVWLVAAGVCAWLYGTENVRSQALAYSEMRHHELTPQVSGTLASLTLELGQTVREGEVIASIDPQDIDDKIAPVRAEIDRLEARVRARRERSRTSGGDTSDTAVKAALCGATPDRLLLQIDMLSTSQASDRGESVTLDDQLGRLKPLLDQRLVTSERLDEMRVRRTALTQRAASRAKEIRRLEECLDLSAEIDLKIQQMALARLERQRVKYDIVAPVSGTIENIFHRPGAWLAAGTQIAELVVPRPDRVIAYITDRQVPVVVVGMRATLTPRGHEGPTLHGRVIALGARIEQVPLRLRFLPTIAQWGRLVTIGVEGSGSSVPGEIYNASFDP